MAAGSVLLGRLGQGDCQTKVDLENGSPISSTRASTTPKWPAKTDESACDAHFPNSSQTSDPSMPLRLVDPSLLFGMERTLYSAINVGMLVVMFGFGLMMVDNSDVHGFFVQGCIIAVAGLAFIGCSWLTHCSRMWMLSEGRPVTTRNSAAWTGVLVFLVFVCIGIELYYGYKYPYMQRSMPVDLNNPTGDLAAMSTTTTTAP